MGLLLGSTFRFLFTVFFLTVVLVPPATFVSPVAFLGAAFDFPPVVMAFRFVVLPLDAVELEFPVVPVDVVFGGGAMPSNRSSSKILSSGDSIDPPIFDNLIRFD